MATVPSKVCWLVKCKNVGSRNIKFHGKDVLVCKKHSTLNGIGCVGGRKS